MAAIPGIFQGQDWNARALDYTSGNVQMKTMMSSYTRLPTAIMVLEVNFLKSAIR